MPRPTVASAEINVTRAADTGPDLTVTCLVRCVAGPKDGPPMWPRPLAAALRKRLHVSNRTPPRVLLADGDDPQVVRLTLRPLQEEALWHTVRLLATLLERNVTAMARISIDVDFR